MDPGRNAENPPQTLVEHPDVLWLDDSVLLHLMWEPQWTQSPLPGLLPSSSIPARWAQQEMAGWWAPPPTIPRLHLEDYMPSPASSNFQIMRQQKTLALARVLQACNGESGFPHRSPLWWCVETAVVHGSLLVLNGDKIVEASLLRRSRRRTPRRRTWPLPYAWSSCCSAGQY